MSKGKNKTRTKVNKSLKFKYTREPMAEKNKLIPEAGFGVSVGQIVSRPLNQLVFLQPTVREGTVIYVHPKGRYYIVEFDLGGKNPYRETYLDCRRINNPAA